MEPLEQLPPGEWHLLPGPRVHPLERDQLSEEASLTLSLIRDATGSDEDFNVFRTFARLGPAFPTHTMLVSQLLGTGPLPTGEKELVILRVAWRTGCLYEWAHHIHMAREAGVDEHMIDEISTEVAAALPPRLQAMVVVADELVAARSATTDTWQRAAGYLSEDELLQLCFLVGHYVMVATVINATGIQPEAAFLDTLTADGT